RDDGPPAAFLLALAVALFASFGLLTLAADVAPMPAAGALLPIAILGFLVARDRERPIRPRARAGRNSPWPDQGLKAVAGVLGVAAILADGRGVVRYLNDEAEAHFPHLMPGELLALGLRVPVILEALDRATGGGGAQRVAWSQRVPTEQWFEARIAPIFYPPRPDGRGGGRPRLGRSVRRAGGGRRAGLRRRDADILEA
ncbi:hypothetical protein J8J40_21320, partial [Mycobacterium tuberculosis]|nr:hypothetical protein [Mycobacterium tuberculosis]